MISLRGVTQRFGERVVLDGLDLDLPDAATTVLTGPNGAGKTTVARLLLGLLVPDAGTVTGLQGRRRAAVFQEDRLCPGLTAVGNVRLVLGRRVPASAVASELIRSGLGEADLLRPVLELSGGQRRRVAIVRALMADADLVVLDEPFTGLDTAGKPQVLSLVRQRCTGRTVLLITHDLAEARWLGAPVVQLARAA
jgi:NitT/TauT family transport system ATP-binding protein